MENQLISYLQAIIEKRLKDNKKTRVIHLFGNVSQIKQFSDFIKNFNQFDNPSKHLVNNLLFFIQQNSHSFDYELSTGFITNKDTKHLLKPLLKPKILYDLEFNHSINTFDNNLFVVEVLIFVLNKLNESQNNCISFSHLIESINHNIEKQFNCYKLLLIIDNKNEKKFQTNDNVLVNFLNDFKTMINFDENSINLSVNYEDIEDIVKQSVFVIIKNLLVTSLYRSGRQSFKSLDDWFLNQYSITYEFMAEKKITLYEVIKEFENEIFVETIDSELTLIDLNPIVMGGKRSAEFELMYRYGHQINGLSGTVLKVNYNSVIIEYSENLLNDMEVNALEFKVHKYFVQIFNVKVDDLSVFLHRFDKITFDVKYVSAVNGITDTYLQLMTDLWFVTRIHTVKHFASCFVPTILDLDYNCIEDNSCEGTDEENDWSLI